jgi:acetyl-CoA C-acetyltransferase
VLGSGLAAETPGLDLQRACGTGLEAAIAMGNKIALGQIDCAIAGGVDTVSDPPVVYPKSFQRLLLKSYRGRSAMQRMRPWFGLRFATFPPVLARRRRAAHRLSMGETPN